MITQLLKNGRNIGEIDTATLKRNPNGREAGNAVLPQSDIDGLEWHQDMLAPDGEPVTLVYQFDDAETRDDDGNRLDPEEFPWDDKHIFHVEQLA